jgi:RNA recognition motif-containing protein
VDTAKKAYKEMNGGELDGRSIRLDSASQRDKPQGGSYGGQGGYGGGQGGFGGGRGGFGGSSRNPGNSTVDLSQDDRNAKKGSIGTFAGKKMAL